MGSQPPCRRRRRTAVRWRRVDAFTFVEVPDTDKVPVLRAYLTLWKFEVGRFFDGVGPDATDSEISAIAVGYPVFRVIRAAS